MTRSRFLRGVAAVGSLTLVAGLAACSTPSDSDDGDGSGDSAAPAPGVTDTEVVVGTHHPLTGEAAAGYATISAATTAYFEYINDNGGINGRSIEYIVKDDGYNPANTSTLTRELVLDDEVFAILNGLGTPPHSAVIDYLNDTEVPDVFVASGSPTFNQPEEYPYTFGFNTNYIVEAKILATYAQENYPDQVYCLMAQDDDLGEDFEAGLLSILGEDGLATTQVYSVSNRDVAAQVAAMQAAGCEVNFLAAINAFSAISIGTAAKLAYQPQWVAASIGGDYNTVSTYLGDVGPALLEGFVSANYLPSHFSETDPWTAHFSDINEQYNRGAAFDGNTVYGMSVAYLFAEALAKSGETPTRESLLAALTSGDLMGNAIVPLSLSETNHGAYSGAQITTVTGGIQEYVGTPFTTGTGDEPVEPYEGGPVPFENEGIPVP
ncbi:ABC transporter substrate-binding protein [Sanguibacter sp. 25GB23B1]|uniref:ABC transporter substrate-binding protein n=1 Tax=unclassified Sanguibacter TaxID=2645534 RepID=UPI0032AF88BA